MSKKEIKVTICPPVYADGYRNIDNLPFSEVYVYLTEKKGKKDGKEARR